MYRGTMWLQPNGSDWGVTTFLTSPKALGLDIARDRATTDALLRALAEVALTPVVQLTQKHLQADDFDRMLAADVVRDLLRWMGDPPGTKARLGANGWAAFCSRSRDELHFDPETEADVVVGERLGRARARGRQCGSALGSRPGATGTWRAAAAAADPSVIFPSPASAGPT